MYRIVILAFFIAIASGDDKDIQKCRHIMHPGLMRCCKKFPVDAVRNPDLKECYGMGKGPASCARDLCIAKKKGFATDDDKLDLEKYEEIVAEDFGSNPDLIEGITKNCINGDLEMYGPPDFCDFAKMRNCLSTQMIVHCLEWSDEGDCKGTKELVEECAKIYS